MNQEQAYTELERKALISNRKGFYRSKLNLITHILDNKGLTYCNISNGIVMSPSEKVKSTDDICPHCIRVKYRLNVVTSK